MLPQVSLGKLGLVVGGLITIVGFVAYFIDNPTLNLVGFFYGIPLLLGGLALTAAELKPVPYTQPTSPEVVALRQQQATATQNQVRQDITRYRYGQSAHLDTALERLGLAPTDEERPIVKGVRETQIDGAYGLILEFDSPFATLEQWQKKQDKMESFFGPGIRVEVTQPAEDEIEIAMISTSSKVTSS
ncbi:DUF2854 domain-containing protein [Chroococcidiopsis sp.]|uniref:DUF2854 domain-containing protein n=1 Tax=Chroococcidiopsis sp. TaxID=3088168 RepID=UPI003F2A103E